MRGILFELQTLKEGVQNTSLLDYLGDGTEATAKSHMDGEDHTFETSPFQPTLDLLSNPLWSVSTL